MAPPGASSPPPPAAAPALNASAACRQLRDPHRSQPSLLDGPLGRLLKDDPSPSPLKDGLHRTLTTFPPSRRNLYTSQGARAGVRCQFPATNLHLFVRTDF